MYNNIGVIAVRKDGTKSFFSKMSPTTNIKVLTPLFTPNYLKICNYLLSLPSLIFFSVRAQKSGKQESISVLFFY